MSTGTPFRTCCVALLLVTAFLSGCERRADELKLIEPRLIVDKIIAREFEEVLRDQSSVPVALVPRQDGDEQTSIDALLAGKADIALVSNNEPYVPGITTVMPMYTNVLHIALDQKYLDAGDEEQEGDEQLREVLSTARIFAGPPDSPSRDMLIRFALEIGFPTEDIQFTGELGSGDTCPDMIVLFVPILRNLEKNLAAICAETQYFMYSMGDTASLGQGSTIEAMTLVNPSLRSFIIPAGLYGPEITPHPVVTLAVDKMLVARRDVPATAIYDLIGEILRVRPALVAVEPTLFHGLRDDFSSADSTFVLHPGAQSYVERNEPNIYERYSGVAEVAVTVFIALVSAFIASVRIYNMRRKNRIDTFYAKAIEMRNSINNESSDEEREGIIRDIWALETHAFDLLVDEKLAADESFRIFITLANDIVEQLKGDRN